MSYYYYNPENFKLYWSGKESAFRTNTHGKDTTNANNDTFYPFPLKLNRPPFIRQCKKKTSEFVAGKLDKGFQAHIGYEDCILVLDGEMQNDDLLLFYTKSTITTAGANPYTHTTNTTVARLSTVPTFEILMVLLNDTDAESIKQLFVGCAVQDWKVSWTAGGSVMMHLEIRIAYSIAGTALTTYPTLNSYIYTGDHVKITFAKGGTAYEGKPYGFTMEWKDTSEFITGANDSGIPSAISKGPRELIVTLDWAMKYDTDYTDAHAEPTASSDIDLTIELERTNTTDEVVYAWEKLWFSKVPTYEWNGYKMHAHYEFELSAFETGMKLTITQGDTKASTRFD